MSPTIFAEISQQLIALGWNADSQSHGIHTYVNESVPGARQEIAIWSMLDADDACPSTDTIQIEVSVRLNKLEKFIENNLGQPYVNEMGKTRSVFLHRLVTNGTRFNQGFKVEKQYPHGNTSIAFVIELLVKYGFPFTRDVATGAIFLNEKIVDSRLLDPMKWEVRKTLFILGKR